MPALTTTISGACTACGAYGGSQHRPTCRPAPRFQLEPSRRAPRDSRTSAAARVAQHLAQWLARDL
jgi:hypothetical protein